MMRKSFDESALPLDGGAGAVEGAGANEGEVLELSGEQAGQSSGELVEGDEQQIEDVVDSEKTNSEATVDDIEPDKTENVTTIDSSATVQAQGEIRSSLVATPGGASPQAQGTDNSLSDDPSEAPAEPTPAPQEPPTNDDGAQNATGDDNGTTSAAQ
jgi:hypothetical protein